jgi:hypothetical protein
VSQKKKEDVDVTNDIVLYVRVVFVRDAAGENKMLIDMDWLWILGLIAAGAFATYWIFNFMGEGG